MSGPFIKVWLNTIEVGGSVYSVDVEDSDRLIDKATVTLDDPTNTMAEVLREGIEMKVDLGWEDAHALIFSGIVARVESQSMGRGHSRVVLTAYDRSWLIRRRPAASASHQGKLSAIVSGLIMREASVGIQIGEVRPDPDPEYTAAAPLLQRVQNDWEFIQEQAALHRSRAFVELNANVLKFYFIPEARLLSLPRAGNLCWTGGGGSLLQIQLERDAGNASPTRSATTTDPTTGQAVTEAGAPRAPEPAPTPTDATRGRTPGGAERLDQAAAAVAASPVQPETLRPTIPQTQVGSDRARAGLAARRDETTALGYRCTGTAVGNVEFRAKSTVGIDGVASWAAGVWYISQVNHLVTRDTSQGAAYRTTFVATR